VEPSSWCGRSGPPAADSKSSSTVATMSMVEAPGAAQSLGCPAMEEDRRGQHWRPSTVSTPPEVDALGVAQRSERHATEGDRG
jgi:hypothetical protein